MPKMKTNSAAKKRFRLTATGRIRRGKANKSHMMRGKSSSHLRRLAKNDIVAKPDEKRIKRLIPYA
ncbi:MAG: 50S ribosomal protein L35 [Myxococcales bacterium]|nr:50S ribosomal protein L35 [Myxococcales bacterium]MCB9708213.1 50S ribosomal protein L35 [Myxococcales bacterium]